MTMKELDALPVMPRYIEEEVPGYPGVMRPRHNPNDLTGSWYVQDRRWLSMHDLWQVGWHDGKLWKQMVP